MAYITMQEAADLLGVHKNTIKNSVRRGDLPQPLRIGRRKKFDREELIKSIKTQNQK